MKSGWGARIDRAFFSDRADWAQRQFGGVCALVFLGIIVHAFGCGQGWWG